MDLNNEKYTYANLVILEIKRILDNINIDHRDYSDADIVNIALGVLRILCEISTESQIMENKQMKLFFNAEKDKKKLLLLFMDLYHDSNYKNKMLNEIMMASDKEDLETILKKIKEE